MRRVLLVVVAAGLVMLCVAASLRTTCSRHSESLFAKTIQLARPGLAVCACCGWQGSYESLLPMTVGETTRPRAKCPVCAAKERQRLACYLIGTGMLSFEKAKPFRLLHFGPEKVMAENIDKIEPVDQIRMDLLESYVYDKTYKGDITGIPLPDGFIHGTIVLHVLEHIPEVESALRELSRVSANLSWILVEVPCQHHATFDCRTMNSRDKIKHCKQRDHVWYFNCQDFWELFEKVTGFSCPVLALYHKIARDFALLDPVIHTHSELYTPAARICRKIG